jgi:AcrR family transcriptional regulator
MSAPRRTTRRPLPEIREEIRALPSPTERYGGYRVQFYRHFANLAEAYANAHATHTQRLERRLLDAGAAATDWRAGLLAALEELALFACESPALARGLLVEARVAGGPATGRRKEVLERLSRAIDSARRESGSRHSPPPLTALFMVDAIDTAVARALIEGQPQRLPDEMAEAESLIGRTFYGL